MGDSHDFEFSLMTGDTLPPPIMVNEDMQQGKGEKGKKAEFDVGKTSTLQDYWLSGPDYEFSWVEYFADLCEEEESSVESDSMWGKEFDSDGEEIISPH